MDYEAMAYTYYEQGYRSGDYQDLATIYGLNEHQADEVYECMKVIENQGG